MPFPRPSEKAAEPSDARVCATGYRHRCGRDVLRLFRKAKIDGDGRNHFDRLAVQ
jgi:hypothetical protein